VVLGDRRVLRAYKRERWGRGEGGSPCRGITPPPPPHHQMPQSKTFVETTVISKGCTTERYREHWLMSLQGQKSHT